MRLGDAFVSIVLCALHVLATGQKGVRANKLPPNNQHQHYYEEEVPPNPERSMEELVLGGGLTRAPSSSPPTHVTAATNFTYFVYTDLPSNQMDQVLANLHDHVQAKLEDTFDDLVGDVRLTSLRRQALSEGCPSNTPPTVPASYTTCAKYITFIDASMERQWDVDIFGRTVVQVVRNHLQVYNTESTTSAFVVYNHPMEVRTQVTLLLVGARQLMTIYEHSFLADILHISALDKRARANDPPLNITNVDYIWQKVVPRGAPSSSDQGNTRGRHLQQTPDLPPSSIQTELLIVAQCAGYACTDEALSQFVLTTFPQVNDAYFENLKKWSETNYFRNGAITGVVLDTEDATPTFINAPELPPESDYRTPGVMEADKPLWIWFALLIALGAVFLACVYVTFCITARDFQAARKMRRERRQAKQKEQPELPEPLPLQSDDGLNDVRDAVPPSPARQRYFASRASPPPEQPAVDLEFDISESAHVAGDANNTEVPPSPSPEKKKKKKKKKKSSSSPDKTSSKSDSPKKSSSKTKSASKKKKPKEENTDE